MLRKYRGDTWFLGPSWVLNTTSIPGIYVMLGSVHRGF